MNVAIRVDASRAIGTGHVRRMLSLAVALRRGGASVRFVTRETDVALAAMIREAGHDCLVLPDVNGAGDADIPHGAWAGASNLDDAEASISVLGDWGPDWIVVDHYGFDARWHRHARAASGARIAVIDDLADRAIDADLLVDHNYARDHRAKYAGRGAPKRLLGGPRFALLGPEFANAPRCAVEDAVPSIGIFMGGVDAAGLTGDVLEAVRQAGFDGPVELVTTSANPALVDLRARVASDPAATLSADLPDLSAFFARHGVQVGAGGGATWERCCIGAPTLLMAVAENQLAVVPDLAADKVVAAIDPPTRTDVTAIADALRGILADAPRRREMAARSRALVDGRGAERVAMAMLGEALAVRPATPADSQLMHEWRNHPQTRAVSHDRDEIAFADHDAWLARALVDPARSLWIARVGGISVGVIRFDRTGDDRAVVSLYLDPALHGLGLGRAMLLAGEQAAADGLDIVAEVVEGNTGSARLFASAGYSAMAPGTFVKSGRRPRNHGAAS